MSSKKKHVVIVVHNLPVPYDRRVWLEATTLVEAGYSVTVVSPATEMYPEPYETIEGVNIRRFKLRLGETKAALAVEFAVGFVKVAFHLARLRLKGAIDVLHVCNPPEIYWPLAYILRPGGTKFLFDHHDLSPEMYRAKFKRGNDIIHRALIRLERETFRAADAALTTNESYRKIVIDRTGFDSDAMTTVRSGPSLDRFKLLEPDSDLRQGASSLLVFLGEIGEQDGVEALIETAALLKNRGRDVHTLVIGDGPGKEAVEALAHELSVAEHITFAGRISDDVELSRMLSSADVGVVPDPNTDWSRHSTMNKVMEYMFFAMPVAAFDLIETRVSAGEAAAYAEPDNIEALADAIEGILDNPARASEMGEAGRNRVLQELAWDHSTAPLIEAYQRLTS